ncbi:hypothetical protein DPMN_036914 [Dreissena polymorpha]|uniref:Uncharacterized protein n=1 Tax=Dreissena polymorpha TaxID=45954 RepID=A0A9D4RPA3_DREPO|nr:hypothetical protein DPMN_036914 [Dreissena polymorpha]
MLKLDQDVCLPLYHTDSCDEGGRKAVTCEEGYVIKVVDVRCMPANYTCREFDLISRLCNGITSCAQVDVRPTFMPSCRTNLCGDDTPNLRRRRGSVFHLVNISCYNCTQQCPSNVYDRVYRLCQSQRDCNLNELQAKPATIYLQDTVYVKKVGYINVYVDHIRVDVLTNPGFPGNHDWLPSTCYWAIYSDRDRGEEVVPHSVEGTHVCDTQYLQLCPGGNAHL